MLNRFKIGTKLTMGFVIVLALLVVVWITGRIAIIQITQKNENVIVTEGLTKDALKLQRDMLDTLVSAYMETITREQQYADLVKTKTGTIKTKYEEVGKLITEDKLKDQFKDVLKKVDDFAASDVAYWACETKRKETFAEMRKYALNIVETVESMNANILQVTKEHHAVTQAGETYYLGTRVEMILKIEAVACIIRDVRRLCYQIQITRDHNERTVLSKELAEMCKNIGSMFKEIEPMIESAEGKKIFEQLGNDVEKWSTLIQDDIELEICLGTIDEASTKLANSILADCDVMTKGLDAHVEIIMGQAKTFNTTMQWFLIVVSVFAIILGLVVSYVLMHNITSGIGRTVGAMRKIADDGNVSIEIDAGDLNRGDEVGGLAHACNNILQQFRNVEHLANDLAEGNYNVETRVRSDQDSMNINLKKMLDKVNDAMREINEGVKQVATGAGEVSSASQSLSNGAQESAASLEEITASMNEISSQTKGNATNAGQARDLAQQASKAAANGQDAMKEMTGAMNQIMQNSAEIQRVIKVIDDIAFQTNLLALNAAVEAARAGQHGKGFAVVAEEVRNLASRSAKAAKETSELIAKSGNEIERGGEVSTRTAEVLNTIVEQIKQTTDIVAGIAIASNEQAEGVNQVTIGLQQIDSVTQQNTAAAEESASAANEMSGMAANLLRLVSHFKLRNQSPEGVAAEVASSTPAKAKFTFPAADTKKPIPPLSVSKPTVAKPFPVPVVNKSDGQKKGTHPSEPVAGDAWGGGGNAEIRIDLDDKNFGKY